MLISHLPLVVYNESSPWYGYLTHVYRTAVPLPFDLHHLFMFYPGLLPTNTHRCNFNPWAGESPTTTVYAVYATRTRRLLRQRHRFYRRAAERPPRPGTSS